MAIYTHNLPGPTVGAVTRQQDSTTEPCELLANTEIGLALVVDATTRKLTTPTAASTTEDFKGVLVLSYPSAASLDGPDTAVPQLPLADARFPHDVLRRGYVAVQLRGTAEAAKYGQVYVRVDAATASQPLGGFEAAADGANTVEFNATFNGPMEAGNAVEIVYNI